MCLWDVILVCFQCGQVQPLYPRVTELVARRIELLRGEQPHLKVLLWDKMRAMVREEVNRLLSERQLMFICNCLANAGVVSGLSYYAANCTQSWYH